MQPLTGTPGVRLRMAGEQQGRRRVCRAVQLPLLGIAARTAQLLAAAFAAWATAPAQAAGAPPLPVPVQAIQGRYCTALGPANSYVVAAENPQRVAFGADFVRVDQQGGASYAVFGGGAIMGLQAYATPEIAVNTWISQSGQVPVRWGRRMQVEPGVTAAEYQTPTSAGLVLVRVLPQQNGFVVVMRTAAASRAAWPRLAPELVAVARSLRCNVPMVPPAADPPPRPRERSRREAQAADDDSHYNQWLGTETYHDSRTGQQYWVRPSQDWSDSGPQGAGYYIHNGNDTVRLEPGYGR